ncbi:hypothetical protein BZA05DRAFT_420238 [Tricharina praecox]|uniref:uncharacterized protein n=1 Tax=Tricharina praecox TaxID=43433 RepID=UPI002221009A|nr:uncharacterized protein BZA05DRAFT_420238 [Tricharina praecox]KAI5848348.1 hypothetical protein BZA05DRAFT_420238 [Tricharina praecox]
MSPLVPSGLEAIRPFAPVDAIGTSETPAGNRAAEECTDPACAYVKALNDPNPITHHTVHHTYRGEDIDHILAHLWGVLKVGPPSPPSMTTIPACMAPPQPRHSSWCDKALGLRCSTATPGERFLVSESGNEAESGHSGWDVVDETITGGLTPLPWTHHPMDDSPSRAERNEWQVYPEEQRSQINRFDRRTPTGPKQVPASLLRAACPYIPALDPRYFQAERFSGPSHPLPVPPQHSWTLPRGITLGLHPRPRTEYATYFDSFGASLDTWPSSRFGRASLKNSRGVFLKPIPVTATLAAICDNIRGGALERVDFHDYQGRTCVGAFFVVAEEAAKYVKFCREQGGVYWAHNGIVSTVEAIPRAKGGHEPIKVDVSRGILREGATRCLRVCNLPNTVDVELLKFQVRTQSRNVLAEVESLRLIPETNLAAPTFTMFLNMATIGTALGAKLRLQSLKYYADCSFEFLPDPVEGSLEDLGYTWACERYWDQLKFWDNREAGETGETGETEET